MDDTAHRDPVTPHARVSAAALAATRDSDLGHANRVLRRSMQNLVSLQELPAFLRAMLREANTICAARMAAIFLYDERAGTLKMACSVTEGRDDDIDHDPGFALWRQPVPKEIAAPWVDRLRCEDLVWFEPESMQHALAVPASVGWHAERGHRLVIDIPLIAGGRLLGLFGQCFTSRDWPDAFQLDHARVLAQHVSVALQMARLADDARQAALAEQRVLDELERARALRLHAEALTATNRTLQTTLDVLASETRVEHALGHVLLVLAQRLGARSAALWLREAGGSGYRVHLVYGDGRVVHADADDPVAREWPHGRDLRLTEHIVHKRAIAYPVDALAERDADLHGALVQRGVRSLLGVPLILGDDVIGSFTARFDAPREFADEQLQLVQALGHQATLVLRLRDLSERSVVEGRQTAVLAERNRIGREIHDGLAQCFAGQLMQIDAMQAALADPRDARLDRFLDTLRELARHGLAETRHSVEALQPMAAAGGGLLAALRQSAERSSVPGKVHCRVEQRGVWPRLKPALEHELYRIACEALGNALRHAQPAQVVITLRRLRRGLSLTVRDDGCGFDPLLQAAGRQGFGLDNMRERARSVGGRLVIVSRPAAGTRVVVHLTLDSQDNAA